MTTRNPQQTRERLLQTAFAEIHAHGYQGMRVDEVLRHAGLQKGAFYHHFGSKSELGYTVLEEQIAPLLKSIWVDPLEEFDDPVEDIPRMLATLGQGIPPAMREHGCPLNNLAQEMSSQDEGFRLRIQNIFEAWVNAFTALFDKAKLRGQIRQEVNSEQVARFIIAVLEGCIGLFKVEKSPLQWEACLVQISAYLHGLRPPAP